MTIIFRDVVGLVLATGVFLIAALAIELKPDPTGPILVVANPFAGPSALQMIAESKGLVVGAGPAAWLATGTDSGDGTFRRDVARRATLVLKAVPALCARGIKRTEHS